MKDASIDHIKGYKKLAAETTSHPGPENEFY